MKPSKRIEQIKEDIIARNFNAEPRIFQNLELVLSRAIIEYLDEVKYLEEEE